LFRLIAYVHITMGALISSWCEHFFRKCAHEYWQLDLCTKLCEYLFALWLARQLLNYHTPPDSLYFSS